MCQQAEERGWQEPHQVQQKQAQVCIWCGLTRATIQSVAHSRQSSCAEGDSEVGWKVNASQQHAIVAKVATVFCPLSAEVSPAETAKWTFLSIWIFLDSCVQFWSSCYNKNPSGTQHQPKYPIPRFCAKIKYVRVMKPCAGYTCQQEKGRFGKLVGAPN